MTAKLTASERALVDAEKRSDEAARQHAIAIAAADRDKDSLQRQYDELHDDKLLA